MNVKEELPFAVVGDERSISKYLPFRRTRVRKKGKVVSSNVCHKEDICFFRK